jgi:hypothetical protein
MPEAAVPQLANFWLKHSHKVSPPGYVLSSVATRDVQDEYGVNRIFEMQLKPGSKTWTRGSVSLAQGLNVARGDASGSVIWYDPTAMTAAQALQALQEPVAAALRNQIAALEHQLEGLLALPLEPREA